MAEFNDAAPFKYKSSCKSPQGNPSLHLFYSQIEKELSRHQRRG